MDQNRPSEIVMVEAEYGSPELAFKLQRTWRQFVTREERAYAFAGTHCVERVLRIFRFEGIPMPGPSSRFALMGRDLALRRGWRGRMSRAYTKGHSD